MKLMNQYAPILDSLAIREQKMNTIIVSLCISFSVLSILFIIRFFVMDFYTPEDGLLYYQIFVEIGTFVLLLLCTVLTLLIGKKHTKFPRYLFTAIYLLKAITTTIFVEFDYFIFYIIPILFSIGYYNLYFTLLTCIATMVSYIGAEIFSAFYGIVHIEFYDVVYSDNLLFQFNAANYASNRLFSKTVPIALILSALCLLCVFLAKNGADSLLRENRMITQKAAIDKELALGNEIQQSMLPDRILHTPYFSAFSYMVSAKNVGGDFFDYFMLEDSRVLITIGDVSGKGISASLFASNTKALIRAYAGIGYAPDRILQETNASLCGTNKKKLFVTIWLGILDFTTGDFSYCNAGHNPPILKRADGTTSWLKCSPNFVVGRRKNIAYTLHHMTLNPNDAIVLYTDGVTEAMNADGDFYGEARLLSFASSNPIEDYFTKKLRKEVFAFRGEAEQNDDFSLACLSFTKYRPIDCAKQSFKATNDHYPLLCEFVMQFASRFCTDNRTLNDIELSLGEVFSNIVFYASPDSERVTDVAVTLTMENQTLSIQFSDNGIPFNPLQRPVPSLEENRKNKVIGGFGIFMVRKLMDDVTYQYNNQNILTLKKNLMEEST